MQSCLQEIDDRFDGKRDDICHEDEIDDVQWFIDEEPYKNDQDSERPEFEEHPVGDSEGCDYGTPFMLFLLFELFLQFFQFQKLFPIIGFDRFQQIWSAFNDFMDQCHTPLLDDKNNLFLTFHFIWIDILLHRKLLDESFPRFRKLFLDIANCILFR